MFETTPPQPLPAADGIDLADLADPLAGVAAAELTSSFVQLCMCSTEPIVSRLAGQEVMLRKPGGIELSKRMFAQQLYRRIDADVFHLLRSCVPLSHAEIALAQLEDLLRLKFAEVVETAASYVLSDDRDTAIQMACVATTMAARELRGAVAGIIGATHLSDEEA